MATSGLLTPTAPAPRAADRAGRPAPVQEPAHGAHSPAGSGLVALADRCVQCGLCLPHCPTYALDHAETESPRGRIAYVRATASGAFTPTPAGDRHLDHCLGCLRCQAACPAGVEYASLLVGARALQRARAPLTRRARGTLALLRSTWLPFVLQAYGAVFPLLPKALRPLPRPPVARSPSLAQAPARPPTAAIGPPVVLFAGCVSSVYETATRAALVRLLAAAGIPVQAVTGQACCGAAAAHAGDLAGAERLAAANRAALGGGVPVLCLASGCQGTLAHSLEAVAPVEDALVALARRADTLRFADAAGLCVALHVPCTQSTRRDSVDATRRLLACVPGLRVVELPDSGCCGAAGMHMHDFPARAATLRAPLLEAFLRSGAAQLLSANIGCRLHLANALDAPVRHPLDLLGELLVSAPTAVLPGDPA